MADLMNRGVAKGPEFDNCSHCCILFWPASLHDPDCWPVVPRTEAEQLETKAEYQRLRVHAKQRASELAYEKLNHLQRNHLEPEKKGEQND